jgi:hypothetical protein
MSPVNAGLGHGWWLAAACLPRLAAHSPTSAAYRLSSAGCSATGQASRPRLRSATFRVCKPRRPRTPPARCAGQTYWRPHNRPSTRRLQNMGFTPDEKIWLTTKASYWGSSQEEGGMRRRDWAAG